MGIFRGRVVTQARIDGPDIYIDAVVRDSQISFTIALKQNIDADFSPFREITVEGTQARCSVSMFSPYKMFRLSNSTIEAIYDAVEASDFTKLYNAVLDEIAGQLSLDLALNPYSEKKHDMEYILLIISKIKENVMDGRVIEDPTFVLKRLHSTVKPLLA